MAEKQRILIVDDDAKYCRINLPLPDERVL